ncbi:hypothetical protein N9164_00635 [Draconibacterium sp.]|nr:hypothetical protein [Draconibacterium sp.]
MNQKMKTIGAFVLGSAIIWAAVIVGSAYALKGTECYDKIQNILVGGVISHLILIWGPLALQFKKLKKE